MTNRSDCGLLSLSQAHSLSYPCTAFACFDYFATGEGRTIGLIVMHATSADALLHAVNREFGDYFSVGAHVGAWRGIPEGFEALDPLIAFDMLDDLFAVRPMFVYSAKLHFNAA